MKELDSGASTGSSVTGTAWRRRGVVAGLVALVAGAASRFTTPVEAADTNPLLIGEVNTATSTTTLQRTNSGTDAYGLQVTNSNGGAMYGFSSNAEGVRGDSGSGTGLAGNSTSGTGLIGNSTSSIGVYGNTSSGLAGMRGDAGSGTGVAGNATSGLGVAGTSNSGVGVAGTTTGSGLAGQFTGPVFVSGTLTVTGIKSAAVRDATGDLRRLYCLESPESYFEDFGEAKLENGEAHVQLDGEFAQLVRTDRYQVFLTEYADSGGLYVARRSPSGFTVRARHPDASGTFGYRIVARRGDIAGTRLEGVQEPKLRVPLPTPVPGLERLRSRPI